MNWFQALSAVVLEHAGNTDMGSYPQTRETLEFSREEVGHFIGAKNKIK